MNREFSIKYQLEADNKVIDFDDKNILINYLSEIERSIFYEPKKIRIDISVNKDEIHRLGDKSGLSIDEIILNLCNKNVQLKCNISQSSSSVNKFVLFAGYFEQINAVYSGNQIILKAVISDPLDEFNRTIIRYYSSDEQKSKYPLDCSLDFINQIDYRTSMWGNSISHANP